MDSLRHFYLCGTTQWLRIVSAAIIAAQTLGFQSAYAQSSPYIPEFEFMESATPSSMTGWWSKSDRKSRRYKPTRYGAGLTNHTRFHAYRLPVEAPLYTPDHGYHYGSWRVAPIYPQCRYGQIDGSQSLPVVPPESQTGQSQLYDETNDLPSSDQLTPQRPSFYETTPQPPGADETIPPQPAAEELPPPNGRKILQMSSSDSPMAPAEPAASRPNARSPEHHLDRPHSAQFPFTPSQDQFWNSSPTESFPRPFLHDQIPEPLFLMPSVPSKLPRKALPELQAPSPLLDINTAARRSLSEAIRIGLRRDYPSIRTLSHS